LLADRVTRLSATEAAALEVALDTDATAPAGLVDLLRSSAKQSIQGNSSGERVCDSQIMANDGA